MNRDVILVLILLVMIGTGGLLFVLFQDANTLPPEIVDDSSTAEDADRSSPPVFRRRASTEPARLDDVGTAEKKPVTPNATLPISAKTKLVGTVKNPTGEAVASAVVVLCEDVSEVPRLSVQGMEFLRTKTDASGLFSFERIPVAEKYFLYADHSDFALGLSGSLLLPEGRTTQKDVFLRPGMTIEGIVVDEVGATIPDVKVVAYDQTRFSSEMQGAVERVATSGGDGRFVLGRLVGGSKRISAFKDGYATATDPTVMVYPNREAKELRLTLRPGHSFSGIVMDRNQNPVGRALIAASLTGRAAQGRSVYHFPPIRSNEDGTFVYDGLEKGAYFVTCTADGYAGGHRLTTRTGKDDVRIELTPNAVIRGQVVDAITAEPVESFSITMGVGETLLSPNSRLTQKFSDEKGRFEYRNVRRGDFHLFARAKNYGGGRSHKLAVAEGAELDDVIIQMHRGAKLKGAVRSSLGQPIVGVRVGLISTFSDASGGGAADLRRILGGAVQRESRSTTTDKDGKYVFDNVAAGNYMVNGSHQDFATGRMENSIRVPMTGDIIFPDLVLMAGGKFMGTVYGKDKKPSPRAKIQFVSTTGIGGPYFATSDKDGKYTIERVQPGIYRVTFLERDGVAVGFEDLFFSQNRSTAIIGDGETIVYDMH